MNFKPRHLPAPDQWLWTQTWSETLAAGLDPLGLGRQQCAGRLKQLLEVAAHSPFYRARFGAKPRFEAIEPVEKKDLMRDFDHWATDRRITRESVERFLQDPARLADAYLDEYLVWTSSGTTGHPGIFVQDARSLAVFDALDTLRLRGPVPSPLTSFGNGQRFAFAAATGGHFAGVASIERLRRIGASMLPPFLQWMRPAVRTFSVLDPLRTLVQELQDYAPTVLITYPSCAAALAQQQSEGILKLSLTEIWLGGEQLSGEQRLQIRSAFGCPLRNNYGSSEFFSMAWECRHGALHMNSDWLILEPVDRKLRPVPVGEPSHSVLLTNLANHVQPLLRYRLGDSVRFVASPCSCGSQFPVIEVQGRADYTLALQDNEGHELTVLPLALITAIEEAAQVTQFQILRTSPDTLEIRLETEVPQAAAAFKRARDALAAFLARHGLSNVRITHGKGTPLRQPHSGKLCRVMDNTTANSSRPHPQARSPHIIVH